MRCKGVLVAVAAALAAATGANAATTLSVRTAGHTGTCAPGPSTLTHTCNASASAVDPHPGKPRIGVDMWVHSPWDTTQWRPTFYDVEASGSAAAEATHLVPRNRTRIEYVWTYQPYGGTLTDMVEGEYVHFATLRLVAEHTTCATCKASVGRLLAGEDPLTGETPRPIPFEEKLAVTLRNATGAPVPPGEVRVRMEMEGRAAAFARPSFSGRVRAFGSTEHVSLTAG